MPKPPLGVMPHNIWIDLRLKDLSEAINRKIQANLFDLYLIRWLDELNDLLKERNERA